VTLTGATVTATPGSAVLTTGALGIAPVGVTVTATPGSMEITTGQTITPVATTVTVTPGSTVLTSTYALAVTGPTVTATPGTAVLTSTYPVVITGATVTTTPGSVVLTTGAANITLTGASVSATPGSVGLVLISYLTGTVTFTGTGSLTISGSTDSHDAPVDPYDATERHVVGMWFRHTANGRLAWMTGAYRGKFAGLSDWERVSPLIWVNSASQQEMQDYVHHHLVLNAGNDEATTSAAIYTLLDGLYPVLKETPNV